MIFVDDLGRRVSVPSAPRRIVSLAPSVTENLFAVGAGRLVVGVTTADDYPPEATPLPRVGDFYRPQTERIRALQPDLVILESATVHRSDMDNLQARLQAPVYAASSHTYADVNRQLNRLGEITGYSAGAKKMMSAVDAKAASVARHVAGTKPVTVFVQIDPAAFYAAGPGTFIDDLIRLAGGQNIVRGTNPFPLFSRETLIAADPAFYVFTVPPTPGGRPPTLPPVAPALRELSAVREHRVRSINSDILTRPTARLVDGLDLLARILHPSNWLNRQ